VLIVVDTLARCFTGGDENSSKDMGRFVAACDALRKETGATVLVVHHSGKDKSSERGSSALRGAADAMFEVTNPEFRKIHVRCTKQKEGEVDRERVFDLRVVAVGFEDDGKTVTSCRLEEIEDETPIRPLAPGETTDELESDDAILKAMRDSFFEDGASASALIDASGVSRSTIYRRLKMLVERGDLLREGVNRSARYRLPTSATGAQVSVPVSPVSPCPIETTATPSPSLSLPPPLKGGPKTETETSRPEKGPSDA
jgi:DNA-binding Lrp family transcriptional regulator